MAGRRTAGFVLGDVAGTGMRKTQQVKHVQADSD